MKFPNLSLLSTLHLVMALGTCHDSVANENKNNNLPLKPSTWNHSAVISNPQAFPRKLNKH